MLRPTARGPAHGSETLPASRLRGRKKDEARCPSGTRQGTLPISAAWPLSRFAFRVRVDPPRWSVSWRKSSSTPPPSSPMSSTLSLASEGSPSAAYTIEAVDPSASWRTTVTLSSRGSELPLAAAAATAIGAAPARNETKSTKWHTSPTIRPPPISGIVGPVCRRQPARVDAIGDHHRPVPREPVSETRSPRERSGG